MDARWTLVTFCAAGYLVGSLPVGYWATRWRRLGLDIRGYGSGNVGTANIYRHAGFALAAVIGPIQFVQGLLPLLLARYVGDVTATGLVLVAIAAVVGNGWSVFLGFDGGRGVAVSDRRDRRYQPHRPGPLLACFGVGALRHHIAEGVLVGFIVLPPAAVVIALTPLRTGFALPVGLAVLLVLVLARRLAGVVGDVNHFGGARHVILDRILHDRRPGRPLVGHRTDP